MIPKFQHDCKTCVFLGHYEGHDLYWHPGRIETTVIARFGSEGHEYASGLPFANDRLRTLDEEDAPRHGCRWLLRVAWLIASDAGLADNSDPVWLPTR